jgi:hypothetical protein
MGHGWSGCASRNVTHRRGRSAKDPPFGADIGYISIKTLAAQIRVICATSRVGQSDRLQLRPPGVQAIRRYRK